MTHVLFVDSNVPGFDTMRIALDRGYVVSFLQPKHRLYTDTDLTKSVKAGVHNLISIEDPTSFYEVARAMALIQSVLPIDGVITQLEPCADAVAKACVVHNIRFTNATAVQNSKNKRKARELVEQAKLKSGFHAIGKTADDVGKIAVRYGKPVVVKPQVAFDSILPVAAQTSQEAKLAAQDILDRIDDLAPEIRGQIANGLLVEELLVGPLVSIELGLLDGEFFRFMISGRPRAKANDGIGCQLGKLEIFQWAAFDLFVCQRMAATGTLDQVMYPTQPTGQDDRLGPPLHGNRRSATGRGRQRFELCSQLPCQPNSALTNTESFGDVDDVAIDILQGARLRCDEGKTCLPQAIDHFLVPGHGQGSQHQIRF